MELSFIQWIIAQAGLGGIAALSLYLLDRNHKESKETMRQLYEDKDAEIKRIYEDRESEHQRTADSRDKRERYLREVIDTNTKVLSEAVQHLRTATKCPILSEDQTAKFLSAMIGLGEDK